MSVKFIIVCVQTLSYNGWFRFKTLVDTVSGVGVQGPATDIYGRALIILVGNYRMKLFYVPPSRVKNQRFNQQEYEVRLQEVC